MRNRFLAVLALALFVGAPLKADSCPVFDGLYQQSDEPWAVFAGSGSYLGVDTRDVTKERVAELKLRDESGVEVLAVDQDAPAGKAGIKEKDVILTFNGQKVEGQEQLRRMIRETPSGRQIALGISRGGQLMNVPVTIGDRKQAAKIKIKQGKGAYAFAMPAMPAMPPMEPMDIPSINVMVTSSARNGLMVESLTPQLAEFFGVKGSNGGVLVRSVEKGSAAETAGLRAGDVIVRVDKDTIEDVGDWRRAVRNRKGATPITIVRDKREQTVNMTFPERKNRDSGMVFNDDGEEYAIDMQELQRELDRIRPEIEANAKEISMNVRRELNSQRGEIDRAMRETQREIQKAMREQQREMENARRELEKAQREADKD